MFNDLLKKIGLDDNEAQVYETLLSLGRAPMGKLLTRISLKRGTAYNVVYSLIEKGLAVEREEAGRKVFEILHPDELQGLIRSSETVLKQAQQSLAGALPDLKSAYNLVMHRPNVQFFEGTDNIERVANDSLTASGEIYSYIDNEAVNRFLPDINKRYVGERERRGLKKKMITIDSPWLRKHATRYRKPLTDLRVVTTAEGKGFATVMQIYDNKVSYITLDETIKIAIIIEDVHIAQMHKTLFEITWKNATRLSDLPIVLEPDDAQA